MKESRWRKNGGTDDVDITWRLSISRRSRGLGDVKLHDPQI